MAQAKWIFRAASRPAKGEDLFACEGEEKQESNGGVR
jgi:hypothetical protein